MNHEELAKRFGVSKEFLDRSNAIHEAGHVIVAYVLCPEIEIQWVSLQERARATGGLAINSHFLERGEWGRIYLAGSLAQAKHIKKTRPPNYAVPHLLSWIETTSTSDADGVARNLPTAEVKPAISDVHKILEKDWQSVEFLASELEVNETLFGDEAYQVFLLGQGTPGKNKIRARLDNYRKTRREVPPPSGLNAPWYEDFDSWRARNS